METKISRSLLTSIFLGKFWNSLTFPWLFSFFLKISLTENVIPWLFPDLEIFSFSRTFSLTVATLIFGWWSVWYHIWATDIDLVFRISCLHVQSISNIIWGRNPKFGVWMHLWLAECRIPFLGHFDLLTSDLVSSISVSGAYPKFIEIGIPNMVNGCILGLQSVAYHLGSLWQPCF